MAGEITLTGSRYLALWSSSASSGIQIQIPFQAITVHAQVGASVLLELNLSDSNTTANEDIEHLTLRITPTSATPASTTTTNGNAPTEASTALYKAIGDCQELNPDPMDRDSDEDGGDGFDETAPGATGWITSENMDQFVDAEGNFMMPEGATVIGGEEEEPLGQGAGRVRRAEEIDGVDGEEEEGKWRKTG